MTDVTGDRHWSPPEPCYECSMRQVKKPRILTPEQKAGRAESGRRWREANPGYSAEANRRWREANPDYQAQWRAANPGRMSEISRKSRRGVSQADFEALLQRQGGQCAICKVDQPGGQGTWHVDHDHGHCSGARSCGSCVRGLLCTRCNTGIGLLMDDPSILRAGAQYLEEYAERRIIYSQGVL